MTLRFIAACLTTIVLGCANELTPGWAQPDEDTNTPPDFGESDPRGIFVNQIADGVIASCGANGAGCHVTTAPAFLAATAEESYDKIIPFKDILFPGFSPTGAKLLDYGETDAHTYVATKYSATLSSTIQVWLAAENTGGGSGGGSGDGSGGNQNQNLSPFQIWSSCMDRGQWDQRQINQRWADNLSEQGECETCHNLGADFFLANRDNDLVFTYVSGSAVHMLGYFTIDPATNKVVANEARFNKVAQGLPPHQEHPRFNPNDNNALNQLKAYVQDTQARIDAAGGPCGAPKF